MRSGSGEGIRASLPQFALLVVVNAFVGAMVGLERSTLPLLAESDFGIASATAAFSFIVTFGLSKALVNLFAGALADRFGRRRVLIAGWLFGVPVPLLVLVAPDWSWVVAANALLGVSQGLAWSMTLNLKLDLARGDERGAAVGWNEFAGYAGLALAAFGAGALAASYGPRVVPYAVGTGLALAGLALSVLVKEPARAPARAPALAPALAPDRAPALARALAPALARALAEGTWRSRPLAAASFAGFATNLKDGVLWGALPLLLAARGAHLADVGLVAAAYPLAWGLAQLATGPLSDRVGRRALVVPGLALQALAVALFALSGSFASALVLAALAGLGTALCYPTLLAFVGDRVAAEARATALGVYRAWRDLGYAAGALLAGVVADRLGLDAAFLAAGAVVALALVLFAALVHRRNGEEERRRA